MRLQQEIEFCLNNEIAYEKENRAEEIIVTREEILAFLMAGFAGYDIKVEGRMLHRNIYDYYDKNEYDIEECTYRKTYIYDSVGRIEAIIFTRIADAE